MFYFHNEAATEKIKILLFGVFLHGVFFVSLLCVFLSLSVRANAIGLKQNAELRDNVITLGDIFYDLPRDEDKVLGVAPRPGDQITLNARTLMKIALALDLAWRPASSDEHIVLRRAATLIDTDAIKAALKKEIAAKGFPGKFDLAIPPQTSEIILPEDMPASFDITKLELDPARGTFSAHLAAPSASNPVVTNRISGAIHSIVEVPVLRDTLRYGDIIGQRDIEMMDVQSRLVKGDILLNPADIIGMTPRRMVFAGKPVGNNDLQAPQIVSRGEAITMIFQSGGLKLTAQGRALEDGAKGDVIRVVNNSSKKSLDAIVTAENEVQVQTY